MKEKEQQELWKSIGYLKGYYDGQHDALRKQIIYEKMSSQEKFAQNMKDFFSLFYPVKRISL